MLQQIKSTYSKNGLETWSRLANVVKWRLGCAKFDLQFEAKNVDNSKFMSAKNAVKLIPNGAVVASAGFAGCGLCSVLFWAIKDAYSKHHSPRNLTWMTVSAQGGRGKIPGTIDELAVPGLLGRYISGHMETAKRLLELGELGELELHTLPQGTMAKLFELQSSKQYELTSEIGIGTFLDPRVGKGSGVTTRASSEYIEANGHKLSYRLPKVQVALLSAPYADCEGNLYFHDEPLISENYQVVRAAKAHAGTVIAMVGKIIEKDVSRVCIPADQVDAIVIYENRPQMAGVPREKLWSALTLKGHEKVDQALHQVKLINTLLGITPRRKPVDKVLARITANLFTALCLPGSITNFGVGMPEEVCRHLYENGHFNDLVFTTESGTYGGVPTSGMFFGAAINPQKIESSAWMFELYRKKLDITVLGFLQVDSQGNVNVSKRGPRVRDFVGPGGFCDIVDGAKTIIFVGSWMVGGEFNLSKKTLRLKKRGRPKFVEAVDQITFNAQQALDRGKTVYYVSNVGVFKLTNQGLELKSVLKGIDVKNDIINSCQARINIPDYYSVIDL